MQAERAGGFRGFLRTRIGRVVLLLIAIGVVLATYVFVADGTVLAIPVFLLVGLALPIYVGLKRPRYLALAGLVVLIVVAPLATLVFSQELLIPPGPASTAGTAPHEIGGSVLQDASISPFSGSTATLYTWQATLYPSYLNSTFTSTNWSNASVQLYVSTCPGATSPNVSYCGGSGAYTFLTMIHNFTAAPSDGAVVTFQNRVPANGIWSWQMELLLENVSNRSNPTRFELAGDPSYDALEGPIVGGFGVVYGALIGTIYEVELLYLGIPFYFVLLLYMWFKGREARHKEAIRRALAAKAARSGTPLPPTGPGSPPGQVVPSGAPGATPAPAGPVASELACPSCGAVVYSKETKCWKCGEALGEATGSAPLSSSPK